MANDPNKPVQKVTQGGILAEHPILTTPTALVGTATSDQQNTIKPALVPIACCCLFDQRFEFDSSFVRPEAAQEFRHLKRLIDKLLDPVSNANPPLSVFGHADPAGKDEYNKTLSGRRAEAVYAVLTRRVDMWEKLFNQPFHGDKWGLRFLQIMLNTLLFDPGPETGTMNPQTKTAVQAFQQENGLKVDGDPGPKTRHKLFEQYMDFLCSLLDEKDTPVVDASGKAVSFQVEKTDFLGGGADPGGKADFQGCSEFNPVLVFSAEENARFERAVDKTQRNRENAPNRRVLVYLFAPGTKVDLGRWPCPLTSEGVEKCKLRFFANAKQRLAAGEKRRLFEETRDTFACRFYHRMASESPCERISVSRIIVRVEPPIMTRFGNVQARMERVDGKALPKVNTLLLGTMAIAPVFAAPDGRLYFFPPADGADPTTDGALPDTGDILELEKPVRWTVEVEPSLESLKQQMRLLRTCGEQVVAQARADGEEEATVRSAFSMVIDDGHLRLADSLDHMPAGSTNRLSLVGTNQGADRSQVRNMLEGLKDEHGPAVDRFIDANFKEKK